MFAQSRALASRGNSIVGMLTRSQFATAPPKVNHHPKKELFFMDVDGDRAFLQYHKSNDVITLQETLVPEKLEGRGLGKMLAKEALDYVANNDLRMKIECTFIQHYLNNYAPQYKKFLAKL
ncbi:protein NATD1 isoform X1 [Hermetia illucens]|nr:protein NATD1 isoform X1 [Hermetia illucens]